MTNKHIKICAGLDYEIGLSAIKYYQKNHAAEKVTGRASVVIVGYEFANKEIVHVIVYQTKTMIIARKG